ncbi:MAG: sodium-dependent transporter, partial [Atribacterota bacterium]|nr:sodium-dependent transporter [Atribacterota bacterium]
MEENGRGQWGSRIGFIAAAAGSAIGLGNIWRFPFITGRYGGGFFVLIYILLLIFVGYPVMNSELLLGRKTQLAAVGTFKKLAPGTPWVIVGFMGVLAGFVILSYYSVVAGWALAYMFKSGVYMAAGADHGSIFVSSITST